MPNHEAARCLHVKVNGTQCGSPALRDKKFCFYHRKHRPWNVECYVDTCPDAMGEIPLPYLEDAHSIQLIIRQILQMLLQKRIEPKTANTMLYALQIASSNLKRVELEKPQPEQVVTHIVDDKHDPIAAREEAEGELAVGTIHACVETRRSSRTARQPRRENAARSLSLLPANARSFDFADHSDALRE